MPESFRNDFRAIMPPQQTCAMARIEPAFNRAREVLMVFALGFDSPWFGIMPQPGVAIVFPLISQP